MEARPMKRLGAAAMLVAFLILPGCGTKVTKENFDKIEAGMTQAAVKDILGEPTETSSMGFGPVAGTTSVWKAKGATITIQFLNDKVMAKQFTQTG